MTFTIDAQQLSRFQQCRRRYVLERSWKVLRWRPRSLFSHCLRRAILLLSEGVEVGGAITLVRARFMDQAAQPGIDVPEGRSSYELATDFCAMLSTTLLAISRSPLHTMHRPEPIAIARTNRGDPGDLAWELSSFADDSGALHRWVIVDAWDAEAISRELHSWHVIGDMAVADAPMTLHVIVIGQSRNGRLLSPWCRAYGHPMIAGKIKFQQDANHKQGPRPLAGKLWKPVWLSDLKMDPAEWLCVMDQDRMTEHLLAGGSVVQPSESTAGEVLRQILSEAEAMRSLASSASMTVPMSRPACDGIVRCPFQEACFVESPTEDLSSLGLYQRRSTQGMRGVAAGGNCDPRLPVLRAIG